MHYALLAIIYVAITPVAMLWAHRWEMAVHDLVVSTDGDDGSSSHVLASSAGEPKNIRFGGDI